VTDIAELASVVAGRDVAAVALDAPAPEDLADAIAAAGDRPVLRPLWRQERSSRGEVDELFDGYGLLAGHGVERLADGQLRAPRRGRAGRGPSSRSWFPASLRPACPGPTAGGRGRIRHPGTAAFWGHSRRWIHPRRPLDPKLSGTCQRWVGSWSQIGPSDL
jgi:hypothetical protein